MKKSYSKTIKESFLKEFNYNKSMAKAEFKQKPVLLFENKNIIFNFSLS